MTTAIQKIESQATRIRNGNAKVHPGQPYRISEAASVGDGVWQGDLGLEVLDATLIPTGYRLVDAPTDSDRQLVPGQTQGARHCLDGLAGVTMYRPADWGADYTGLAGPLLLLSEERTVTHPTHGDITIPSGFAVLCRYQREYDSEQRRARRNAD